MTFDDIQTVWGSPHNRPSPDEVERQKQQFVRSLESRHRGFLLITGLAALWFIGLTVRFAYHVAKGGAFEPSREWAAILLFLLPVAALVVFWRQHFRHRREHVGHRRTIKASLEALLDENRLARLRLKIIAALNGLMLVGMPVIVLQLRAVGKAGDEILLPAFVLFPALMAFVLVALFLRHRRTLLPEKAELEALLRSYESSQT
jgi:hypothetical protein